MVGIPTRYIVAFISFMAISVQYMIRVNISVTIEAMIPSKNDTKPRVVTLMCPRNDSSLPKILFPRSEPSDDRKPSNDSELTWGESDKKQVLSSFSYGYITTQVLAGWASERWGPRYLCGFALLVAGLLSLLAPTTAVGGLGYFIAQRITIGAVLGSVLPSVNSLVAKWLPPKERTKLAALIFSAPSFGSLVGMGASGLLVQHTHWSTTFYVFGSVTVIIFIPWMFLIYDSPSKHPRISQKEKLYILQGLGEKLNEQKVALPVPWRSILTSLPVWAAILFHTGNSWISYTLSTELPTYLMEMESTDLEQSGLYSAVPYFFGWITGSICGFISQSLRDKGLLSHLAAYRVFNGIAAIGGAAALVGVSAVDCNVTAVVVLMAAAAVASSMIYGGSCINHMDLARNYAGTISGLLYTCITLPGILVPITVGAFTEHEHTFPQWHKVFYIAAAISVGSYIVYLMFGSVDEQPWNVPKQSTAIIINTGQERRHIPEEQVNNNTSTGQESTNAPEE